MLLETNDDSIYLLTRQKHEVPSGVETDFVPQWSVGVMCIDSYEFNRSDRLTLQETKDCVYVFVNEIYPVARIMYEDYQFLKTVRIKGEPLCFESMHVEVDQIFFMTARLRITMDAKIDKKDWRVVGSKM